MTIFLGQSYHEVADKASAETPSSERFLTHCLSVDTGWWSLTQFPTIQIFLPQVFWGPASCFLKSEQYGFIGISLVSTDAEYLSVCRLYNISSWKKWSIQLLVIQQFAHLPTEEHLWLLKSFGIYEQNSYKPCASFVLLSLFWMTKSRLTHIDPMKCSTPSFPVLHYLNFMNLLKFMSIMLVMPSNHLLLPVSQPLASGGQNVGASALASVLSVYMQGWFPLGSTGLLSLCCPRYSQASSPALQFESTSRLGFSLLCGPTLTSKHDYWKNHRFNYIDICRWSNVSPF